jgi:hypothetical protein
MTKGFSLLTLLNLTARLLLICEKGTTMQIIDLPFQLCDESGVINGWHVTPTGDSNKDFQSGVQYFEAACEQGQVSVALIDMIKAGKVTNIEIGFVLTASSKIRSTSQA